MERSHKRKSSILAYAIPYQPYTSEEEGDVLKLNLPKIITSRGGLKQADASESQQHTTYVSSHHRYRQVAEPWHGSDLHSASVADIRAINLAFDIVQQPAIVLSMAAWFTTLCTIDDLVEMLPPPSVRQSLLESSSIIRTAYVPHSVSAKGQGSASTDAIMAKVAHVSRAFRGHVMKLLDRVTFENVIDGVCDTWAGIMAESCHREKNESGSVALTIERYMSIRTRTIGLAPFIALLECELIPGNHEKSETLKKLESEVGVLIGLQNDLLGLERDLELGEMMNLVFIADISTVPGRRMSMGQDRGMPLLDEEVKRAVTWHNETLDSVKELKRSIMARPEDTGEKNMAQALHDFVATHFDWARQAQRYRLS